MKTKKIWELEDYKGYMPSEHDLIPAIDVNGDADSNTDFDWDPKAPGAYDNAVTRKLTFGQIKEQMTLMSAKALCNVLGTTLETLTGYKPEPEPTPQPEPEQTGSDTGATAESEEEGPVIPPNGLAYILNHAYSWLDCNLIDLTGYLEEYIAMLIRDAENGVRTRSASPSLFNRLRMTKYVNIHWFDTILNTVSDAILGLDNGAFSWYETLAAGVVLPKLGLPNDYIKIGMDGRYHCPGPVFKSIDAEQQFDNKECLPMYGRSVWEYSEGSWSRYVYEEQDNVPAGYKNISVVEWDGFFFGGMYGILAYNSVLDVLGPRAVVGGSIEGYKKAYVKADPDQITTVDFTFCGIGHSSVIRTAKPSYPALLYKGADPETGAVVYTNWPWARGFEGEGDRLNKQFYETKADWDKAWANFEGEILPAAPAHFPSYGKVGVPALKSGTGEINLLEDDPTLHRYIAPSDNSVLWVDSYLIDGGYYNVPEKYTVDDGDGWRGERAEITADGTWKFYAAKPSAEKGDSGDSEEERAEEIVEWVKNVDGSGVVTQVRFVGEPPVPEDYCERFTSITLLDPDTPPPIKAFINISVDRAFLDETLLVKYGNDLFGDVDSPTRLGNLRTVTWTKVGNDWVPDVQYHWTSKILVKTANLNKFLEANACGLEGTTADFRVTNFKWTHEESVRTDRSFWAGAFQANFTGAQLEKALGNLIFNKLNPQQSDLSLVENSPVDNSYNGDNDPAPEPVEDGNDGRDPSNPDQR